MPRRLVHANAGVGYGEHDGRTRGDGVRPALVARVEPHIPCFDDDRPARGHRVARVYHQVHDHLFELAGVGLDAR